LCPLGFQEIRRSIGTPVIDNGDIEAHVGRILESSQTGEKLLQTFSAIIRRYDGVEFHNGT
jgi:hypothetical protein